MQKSKVERSFGGNRKLLGDGLEEEKETPSA